jgi:hypothetical protein
VAWPPLFGGPWVVRANAFPRGDNGALPWLSDADRDGVRGADRDAVLAAAAKLEAAENGTSLVLMFRFGQTHLLFTGDAEWGTWEVALARWEPLLRRTAFFKVGHHGSFNATPPRLVELLPQTALAMAPTRHGDHNNVPLRSLMTALRARLTRVALSNVPGHWDDWSPDELPEGFRRLNDLTIEATVPLDG